MGIEYTNEYYDTIFETHILSKCGLKYKYYYDLMPHISKQQIKIFVAEEIIIYSYFEEAPKQHRIIFYGKVTRNIQNFKLFEHTFAESILNIKRFHTLESKVGVRIYENYKFRYKDDPKLNFEWSMSNYLDIFPHFGYELKYIIRDLNFGFWKKEKITVLDYKKKHSIQPLLNFDDLRTLKIYSLNFWDNPNRGIKLFYASISRFESESETIIKDKEIIFYGARKGQFFEKEITFLNRRQVTLNLINYWLFLERTNNGKEGIDIYGKYYNASEENEQEIIINIRCLINGGPLNGTLAIVENQHGNLSLV